MPLPAMLLVAAALLPVVGCLILLLTGRRLGTPLAGYVATFFISLSFVCSGWALMRWVAGGNYGGLPYRQALAPIILIWNASGGAGGRGYPGFMDAGIYVDSLSALLFVTVTLAAMLLHIFVTRSMRREPRLPRFFMILSLSCFAVLGLLLCASLLHAIVFLELLSFCGALLVGFRLDRAATTRAGARIFTVNRIGDVGLVLGLGIVFSYFGKLTWPDLWLLASDLAQGRAPTLPGGPGIPPAVMTIAGVALFIGAAARCAQFPLHVWAADAAEGVAPAGAMVFALTQSLGGAFFIARIFPLLTPSARLLAAIVGVTTLVMASLIATVQGGIKQVLAWLSVAQMGLMFLAMGVGSWSGATFHLVAYCFFQVLLFLAAGAVIRAGRGETELWRFGGLVRKMPITAVASAIGVLAACGAGSVGIGLSGYYSRGLILHHAAAFAELAASAGRSKAYWALFALPVVATFLNAFAMTRLWMLVFAGRPRDRRLFDHAREAPTLLWPMAVLAIMTILAGRWLGVGEILDSSIVEAREGARVIAEAFYPGRQPAAKALFAAVWSTHEETSDEADQEGTVDVTIAASPAVDLALTRGGVLAERWLWVSLVLGIAFGAGIYLPGPRLAHRLVRVPPLNWIHAWLCHRMYFDELYDALFVTLGAGLAGFAASIDRNVLRALARGAGQHATGIASMKFLSQSLLTMLLLVPLAGAVAMATSRQGAVIRRTALGTTLAVFAIALLILVPFRWRQALSYDQGPRGSVRLASRAPLAPGVEYHVAVDGLSFPFLVFTTLMFPLLCAASWRDESKGAGHFAALLALEFSVLGTYLSFDFLMMSVFLVISVAAAFALVRSSAGRTAAARVMLIYLSLGIACLVVSLVAMRLAGRTFDLIHLAETARTNGAAIVIGAASVFLVSMAIAPGHGWLVLIATEAPVPAAMAIAILLPITGAYGFMRVVLPLLAHAGTSPVYVFAALAVGSILYGGLCAMASEELKSFVAYSITCSMGLVLLAAILGTPIALDGAVLLLIGQGLAGAMLLLLSETVAPGGGERAPICTAFFGIAWLAWLVAPVLFGQIIILMASIDATRSGRPSGFVAVVLPVAAVLGFVINGISAARMARRTFLPGAQIEEAQPVDLTPVDVTILSVLAAVAILLGVAPGLLCFTFSHPAARALLRAP